MDFLKTIAWKVPVAMLWYIAADFPFQHLPLWEKLIAWFIFFLAIDAIRWGLKREKKPTDTSAYRQHVYIFTADDDSELIMDAWVCSVPDIGEKIVIWSGDNFKHYILKHRIYGMNTDEKVGCWNLYVKEG